MGKGKMTKEKETKEKETKEKETKEKETKDPKQPPELSMDKLKLLVAFAVFVIGVILLIFAIVATIFAPFVLPATLVTGIFGLVSAIGGGLLGWKSLVRLTLGKSAQLPKSSDKTS